MRGPSTGDTLTLPVGNYLSDALRNYMSENPSDLRNFMSADTRAVAAAWRQIASGTALPWWALAAIESAAGAFESQARDYETRDTSEGP